MKSLKILLVLALIVVSAVQLSESKRKGVKIKVLPPGNVGVFKRRNNNNNERAKNNRPIIVSCCGKRKCSKFYSKFKSSKNRTKVLKKKKITRPPRDQEFTRESEETSKTDAGAKPENDETTVQSNDESSKNSDAPAEDTTSGAEPSSPAEESSSSGETDTSSADSAASLDATPSESGSTESVANSAEVTESSAASTTSPLVSASTTTLAAASTAPSTSTTTTKTTTSTTTTTTKTTTTTTTTTTTLPPCVTACAAFKNATAGYNSNISRPTKGMYVMVGSKMVFVSNEQVPLADAVQKCMRLNMSLLVADDKTNIENLTANVFAKMNAAVEFWTSGAKDGEFCMQEQVIYWCSSGKKVEKQDWITFSNNATSIERCLALKLVSNTSFNLLYTDCTKNLQYICEPTCAAPICPATCKIDPLMFDSNNSIKDAEKIGFWLKNACGSSYFFSYSLGSWEESFEKCCNFGMKPIIFETREELDCLSNLTRSRWPYNLNFWTGGSQKDCKGQWRWCSGSEVLPISDNLNWAIGQPDDRMGAENCIHIKLLQNLTGIALSDKNCSNKYVIGCEGAPKLPECMRPTFPPIVSTARLKANFANGSLIDYFSFGKWHTGCGRTFMFSKRPTVWFQALRNCYAMGMTLLSVEYTEKGNCIANTVVRKEFKAIRSTEFWTSGTEENCEGDPYWIAVDQRIQTANMTWSSNVDGDCVTVMFPSNSSSPVYSKNNCSQFLNYVCEIRNNGSHPKALQAECMTIWNVTELDMAIFETEYRTSTLPRFLKCFIKCLGENFGTFANNALVPTDMVLRISEKLAGDIETMLQNSFRTYEKCNQIKREDECDTAADIYQCGKDDDPTVTNAVFSIFLSNTTVYYPPFPCVGSALRPCRMLHLPCNENPTLVAELTGSNKTSMGQYVKTAGGVRYFVSNAIADLTWIQSREYCCSIGMYLANFATLPIFNDFWKLKTGATLTWAFVDETYATGDGTDSWCRSSVVLPASFYTGSLYPEPSCTQQSCFHADMGNSARPFMNHYIDSSCLTNSTVGKYFVCM